MAGPRAPLAPSAGAICSPSVGLARSAPACAGRARRSCAPPATRAAAAPGDRDARCPDTLPVAGSDTDWRSFRAKLVASAAAAPAPGAPPPALDGECWAHALPGPELGAVLLAHPLLFGASQQYFHLAVILIVQHDDRGTVGLILNKPLDARVGEVGGLEPLLPEFGRCPLYLGGDVGPAVVNVLHGEPGLPGAVEISAGVYLGGAEAAKRGVAAGRHVPEQFKFTTRYAGWGPGQLDDECRRGVWFPAAASRHVVLLHAAAPGHDLWHFYMQLLGGEHAELSRAAKGEYVAEIMEPPQAAPPAASVDAVEDEEDRAGGSSGSSSGSERGAADDGAWGYDI